MSTQVHLTDKLCLIGSLKIVLFWCHRSELKQKRANAVMLTCFPFPQSFFLFSLLYDY